MAKNNKTRVFYVLYSDKTRVFDQSERAYYPIYIINIYIIILEVVRLYSMLKPHVSVFDEGGNRRARRKLSKSG